MVLKGDAIRWILDWQRPMRGPLPLERALALLNAGCEAEGPFGRLALACSFCGMAMPASTHGTGTFTQVLRCEIGKQQKTAPGIGSRGQFISILNA